MAKRKELKTEELQNILFSKKSIVAKRVIVPVPDKESLKYKQSGIQTPIQIDEQLKEDVYAICKKQGILVSKMLRNFIQQFNKRMAKDALLIEAKRNAAVNSKFFK